MDSLNVDSSSATAAFTANVPSMVVILTISFIDFMTQPTPLVCGVTLSVLTEGLNVKRILEMQRAIAKLHGCEGRLS